MHVTLGDWATPAVILVAGVALPARGQTDMSMPMAQAPWGVPETRLGSGTSWLPDVAPMHAAHFRAGAWTLMLHGSAFFQVDRQGGPRGDDQVGVVNWAMLAATRSAGGGRLQLRGMLSGEPWTIGAAGYPLLLQSGESDHGRPLHDHQHPHDLFVELAALYERRVAGPVGVSLYLAPVGEPAVGPVAFPHRPSAANDPFAPIAHHWQDATHITFGVLTAGLLTHTLKVEASLFNGREPDERRTDFDYAGRRLDSYGARLSVNPTARWSLSAWYAYLQSPDGLHPEESLHRFGAAALTTQRLGSRGEWASALIYGANREIGTGTLAPSVTLESNLDLDGTNAVLGRAEYVRKSAADLAVPSVPASTPYHVAALTLGYHRAMATRQDLTFGLGLVGIVGFVPPSLAAAYGSRRPRGVALFISVRPSRAPAGRGMTMPMAGLGVAPRLGVAALGAGAGS